MTTEELIAILVMLQGSKHPVRVMRNDNNPKGESFAISEVRSGFNSVDGRCIYILIQSEVNVPDKR